jgi:4a-hydroxytetrahydrobiopterin dehydratase
MKLDFMSLHQQKCVPCKGGIPLSKEAAHALLSQLSGWQISGDEKWLSKKWSFKNFVQSQAFVNKVGELAEAEDHHPDILFGWGYAEIRLQTHSVGGLHENDFILAAKIDTIQ